MPDGGLLSLGEVIGFYDGGVCPHSGQDPRIAPLALCYEDKHTLTSSNVDCLSGEARASRACNY